MALHLAVVHHRRERNLREASQRHIEENILNAVRKFNPDSFTLSDALQEAQRSLPENINRDYLPHVTLEDLMVIHFNALLRRGRIIITKGECAIHRTQDPVYYFTVKD